MSTLFIKGLVGFIAAGAILTGGAVAISEITKSNLNNAVQIVEEQRKSVKEELSEQMTNLNKEINILKQDNYDLELENDKEAQRWQGRKAILKNIKWKLEYGKSLRRTHGGYETLHKKVDEVIKELENLIQ